MRSPLNKFIITFLCLYIFSSCQILMAMDDNPEISKADSLFSILENLDNSHERALVLTDLAWKIHLSDTASKYYEEAIELAFKSGDRSLEAKNLNRLGVYYRNLDLQEEALKLYDEALQAAIAADNYPEQGHALNNIAQIHYYQELYEEALGFYEEAKRIFEDHDYPEGLGYTYTGMSVVYSLLGDFDQALNVINKALIIREEMGNGRQLIIAKYNRGKIYQQMGDLEAAIADIQLFLDYSMENDPRGALYALGQLGNIYFKKQEYEQAEKFGKLAVKINEEVPSAEAMITVYELLYLLENKKQNSEQAKYYLDLLDESRRVFSEEKTKLYLSGLMLQKQKREIAALNREYELLESNQKIKFYLIVCSFALAFILFVFFAVYYRSFKKEKMNLLELRKRQREIGQKTQELDRLNKIKDKIFSILAHDLKAPLDSLVGMVRLIENQDLSQKEFESYLPILSQSLGNNSLLLENLLNWSRSQMSGMHVQISTLDLHQLVEENFKYLSLSNYFKGQAIRNEIPEGTKVEADQNMLDIVMRNLLTNAMKFTRAEEEIKVSLIENEGTFTICVSDQGIGITPEGLQKIFGNDFYSTYGTQKEKGTGLGLMLSKELVERNQGRIWAESVFGEGATFCFTLPKS